MALSVGDKLPDATLTQMTGDGPAPIKLSEITDGRKVVIFGVPGAFTPTCHGSHLPGFLDNVQAFKDKGIDEIVVLTVNDVFVVDQWEKATNGTGKIRFLSDGRHEFVGQTDLEIDLSDFGMGVRSTRFSMLVEDGVVKIMNVEEKPSEAQKTGAAALLAAL